MSSMSEALARAQLEAEARRLGLQPWQLEMAQAVGDGLVRDLVQDFKRGVPQRSSIASEGPPRERRSAGAVASPLAAPPGISLVDQLCELQDRIDRADRERELAKAARPKPGGDGAS